MRKLKYRRGGNVGKKSSLDPLVLPPLVVSLLLPSWAVLLGLLIIFCINASRGALLPL